MQGRGERLERTGGRKRETEEREHRVKDRETERAEERERKRKREEKRNSGRGAASRSPPAACCANARQSAPPSPTGAASHGRTQPTASLPHGRGCTHGQVLLVQHKGYMGYELFPALLVDAHLL